MALVPKILVALALLGAGYAGYIYLSPSSEEVPKDTDSELKQGSLKNLDEVFATDGIYIYGLYNSVLDLQTDSSPFEDIDPKTFRLHCPVRNSDNDYACDATHLVDRSMAAVVVGDYDISTLQQYPGGFPYFKDKDNVYMLYHANFMGKIEGADTSTFSPISGQEAYDAQDKNHKYLQGTIVQPAEYDFETRFTVGASSYECRYRKYTESSCALFVVRGGQKVDLQQRIESPDSSLLLAPDGAHFAVVYEQEVVVFNTQAAEKVKTFTAPVGKIFGVYSSLPMFLGRVEWTNSTTLTTKLYPEGTFVESAPAPEMQMLIL